jgi:hypothetical protein
MGWLNDYRAQQAAEKAAEKAAANGQPEPPETAPGSTQSHEPVPGGTTAYTEAGVRMQLEELENTLPGGRNTALFVAAKALGRMPDVERDWLHDRLIEACELNGYVDDDGMPQTLKTIRSGFAAADAAGPRDIPDDLAYFCNVTVVPMSTFGSVNSANVASMTSMITTSLSSSTTASASASAPSPLEPVMARIVAAERDFWTSRRSLERIYEAGMLQMVPPWALLAQCAARALALVPVRIRLPGTIGGQRGGSLNWFAAVVAESGQGKSSAADLAEELVPDRQDPVSKTTEPLERNVGSGEGVIKAYVKKAAKGGKNPAPAQFHPSILFSCDEIDMLTAISKGRSGSTLLPILRQAFTGATLGFAYAQSHNHEHLTKHSYRLVFVLSGQPSKCGPLLSDHQGGTPQRFQWFPAFDLRIIDNDQAGNIDPLPLPSMGDWVSVPTTIVIPPDARKLIRATKVAVGRGVAGKLSSHEVFVRVKFAEALAVLDGRTDMSDEDWRLSGIAAEVSRVVRDYVIEQLAGAEEQEDADVGRRRGVVADATDAEKTRRRSVRQQEIADRVTNGIRRNLLKRPKTEHELKQAARSEIRSFVPGQLRAMLRDGEIEQVQANGQGPIYWRFASKQP